MPDVGASYTGVSWGEESAWKTHITMGGDCIDHTSRIKTKDNTFYFTMGFRGGPIRRNERRQSYTVNLKSQVHKNSRVSFGYPWNNSNVAFYDENSVLFALDIKSISF